MKRMFSIKLLVILVPLLFSTNSFAALVIEMFEIEGLISPASPKALTAELESLLKVKVVDLNLKNTDSGWPVISIEFDSGQLSREDIDKVIATIEDPAGHKYQVHKGPPMINAPYTEEENDSLGRGKNLYENYCTTCHGLNGGGHGPAAQGITTFPRQLWVWNNSDSSADGYLFWFITNGRNEMPPWATHILTSPPTIQHH